MNVNMVASDTDRCSRERYNPERPMKLNDFKKRYMPREIISYPAKPRITNKPRSSFGPSSGSGIFRHSLIIIGKLEIFLQKICPHECNGADIRYDLVTTFSVYTHNNICNDLPF